MALLPKKSISDLIDAVYVEEYPRPHLGSSIIGDKCRRKTAYSFYWAGKVRVEARLNRIFRMGDFVETQLKDALRSIGVEVNELDERLIGPTGHEGGSVDGILSNVPGFESSEVLLFEGKSMNHSNYLELIRKGVQEAKPTHYVQMQMYMGRLGIPYALYAAENKNDCKIHTEVLPFDEECYKEHTRLEKDVLFMAHINEFSRVSDNPSWFLCKMCDFKPICHGGENVARNCRTCERSELHEGGDWFCTFHDAKLDLDIQAEGCDKYEHGSAWK